MAELKTYSIAEDITGSALNDAKLHDAIIAAACVSDFTGVSSDGTNLIIHGASIGNETTLDSTVEDHVAVSLDEYKQLKHDEIDAKTDDLIVAGFTYDSVVFSLSRNAQINWDNVKNNKSEYVFPLTISALNNDPYSLTDANVTAFWQAKNDKLHHLTTGRVTTGRDLNETVFDAADEAAVDAVVDTR